MQRRKLAPMALCWLIAVAGSGAALADSGHGGGGNSGPGGGGDDHGGPGGGGDDHSGPGGGGDDNSGPGGGGDDGQEQARDATERGKAAPLRELLKIVKRDYPGDVLDVNFQSRNGALVYRVTVLDSAGRRIKVRIDAASRRILGAGP